jgi:exosortase D (VPLPA-CTERM-specific)
MHGSTLSRAALWKSLGVAISLVFLFSSVLPKLVQDWWDDENYSHGLLMPFVIGYIVWSEWDRLQREDKESAPKIGLAISLLAIALLLAGTLGSELFTQRIAFVLMLAGVTLYLFGSRVLRVLLVPLTLLLLSIPIPQIIFNGIALPLQLIASKFAGYGITALGIDVGRRGNIIELIPLGTDQLVGLEVVDACGGIRSLVTLAALAVLLVYLTADNERPDGRFFSFLKNPDFFRGIVLALSAVPIALVTNALRVIVTGAATYYWGREIATGTAHDVFGWITFFFGLVALIVVNEILRRLQHRIWGRASFSHELGSIAASTKGTSNYQVLGIIAVILVGGLFIHWLDRRTEIPVDRIPLTQMPRKIGEWWMVGTDVRFNLATEDVLRATDYIMRDYYTVYGQKANLYIGYYDSQRTGATYHSPKNCLPGSGWQMTSGKTLTVQTGAGRSLEVKRYVVDRGDQRAMMVYWFQGRGRSTSSEYADKLYKIYDSIFMGRSDGAMVRILTPIYGGDEELATSVAMDFAASVADGIGPFVAE